jgi:hypothetical protein
MDQTSRTITVESMNRYLHRVATGYHGDSQHDSPEADVAWEAGWTCTNQEWSGKRVLTPAGLRQLFPVEWES